MMQDRQRRDDAIRAEHQRALARGEKRVLRTTATGALHSYAGDEIGFTPGRGHVQVSTWWGMGIVTTVLWIGFVFSWVLLFAPVAQGEPPMWSALFLTGIGGSSAGTPSGWPGTSTARPGCASNAASPSPAPAGACPRSG